MDPISHFKDLKHFILEMILAKPTKKTKEYWAIDVT